MSSDISAELPECDSSLRMKRPPNLLLLGNIIATFI